MENILNQICMLYLKSAIIFFKVVKLPTWEQTAQEMMKDFEG